MKRLIPFIIAIFCLNVNAQDEADVLRYAFSYPVGTARSAAMGGAFSAAGADFSSATLNPAGLGLYRSGKEMIFTPEFHYMNMDARYYGSEFSDSRTNFNLNNFGYVSSFEVNQSGFIGGTFAIGFNRVNNFHMRNYVEGLNNNNSLAHGMAESANNNGAYWEEELDPFTEQLFFEGYLIDRDGDTWYVDPDLDTVDQGIIQTQTFESEGKMNEWVFSGAFNIDHKFYFGATFALTSVEYNEEVYYEEVDELDNSFRLFDYLTRMETRGYGVSGKFGLIYRPVYFFRIGLSYHTPVSYNLNMTYDADIQSGYHPDGWFILEPIDPQYYIELANGYNPDVNDYILDYGESDFRLKTPAKAAGGVSLTLGKFATVNADVEYINYSNMKLRGNYVTNSNDVIQNIYRDVLNLKGGAEFRISQLYLRGGFTYLPSPYVETELNANADRKIITSGIGFRSKNIFLDFTYTYEFYDEQSILYYAEGRPNTANFDVSKSRFMTTLGFKF